MFTKSKQLIQTVQLVGYVKMCLQIKFYIFLNFFWVYSDGYKNSMVWIWLVFVPILINSKKIPKNVKFGLQAHFNMEITSNGLDRSFGLSKWKYGVEYKRLVSHGSPKSASNNNIPLVLDAHSKKFRLSSWINDCDAILFI